MCNPRQLPVATTSEREDPGACRTDTMKLAIPTADPISRTTHQRATMGRTRNDRTVLLSGFQVAAARAPFTWARSWLPARSVFFLWQIPIVHELPAQ